MTKEELNELVGDCPTLYHMAEQGSWPSIKERGLLSTTALLDLYGIAGKKRVEIEERRRPQSVALEEMNLPRAVIRDQIPMTDQGLLRCLPKSLTPSDWYKILNGKVFFWLTRERLLKLINAGAYRNASHDVLEIPTQSIIEKYQDKIWFCPMNSGCTKPFPHPRDSDTFLRIPDYPYSSWRKKRRSGERVVELAVDYSVPNIGDLAVRVYEMRGDKVLKTLFER